VKHVNATALLAQAVLASGNTNVSLLALSLPIPSSTLITIRHVSVTVSASDASGSLSIDECCLHLGGLAEQPASATLFQQCNWAARRTLPVDLPETAAANVAIDFNIDGMSILDRDVLGNLVLTAELTVSNADAGGPHSFSVQAETLFEY
jgi:hypothetical protein